MKRNHTILLVALLSVITGACENKGFDGTPEDPYSSSGSGTNSIVADTVWHNQFTLNKGIRSYTVINEDKDTICYASFYEDGTPELYLSGDGGVGYEFNDNGLPSIVYSFDESAVSYYTLEYGNDVDLIVPVYDCLGPGLYNFAAIHADDELQFSFLPGLSKVTKRTSENKTIWVKKYVYVDSGSSQWMKIYTENQSSGGGTEVDRIEYNGKLPVYSDSLSIDTILFSDGNYIESYRYRYIDENGTEISETCSFRTEGGYMYPENIVQEGGEYRMEYTYSTQGDLKSLILGDAGQQVYNATYEYDSSTNWNVMHFNGMTFTREILYY